LPLQIRPRRWTRSNTGCALLVAGYLFSLPWVRLNVEPSVPYGLYRLQTVPPRLTRGTLVLLRVPASMQRWHARSVSLLKPVAAVAGDCVCHFEQTLYVNEVDYGVIYTTVAYQSVPHMPEGCTLVPEGEVFLASPAPKSLDSRYFGPVPVATLRHQATPFLTWR
jgi:type IV secretory pathway protease TraF